MENFPNNYKTGTMGLQTPLDQAFPSDGAYCHTAQK